MKKQLLILMVIIALLVSILPVTVFAAAPAELQVEVRNTTGGEVNLDIVDANGNHTYKTLAAGVSEFEMTEGIYNFYVSTICGNYAGVWNLNVNKTLYISCQSGMPMIELEKCEWGYWLWDGQGFVPREDFRIFGIASISEFSKSKPKLEYGCYYGLSPDDYAKNWGYFLR